MTASNFISKVKRYQIKLAFYVFISPVNIQPSANFSESFIVKKKACDTQLSDDFLIFSEISACLS